MGNRCPQGQQGTLSVTGTGTTEVQPDIAKVLLNVQSTKESAKLARDEAAEVAAAVIAAVGAVGGVNGGDITTLDVSVHPQHTWDNVRNVQLITGYTFSQRIQVKVLNLSNDVVGAVIDSAVQAGGDNLMVDTIQMELSPEVRLQATNAARVEAVESAQAAAQVLAQAAGVTLGAIKSFSDVGSGGPSPYMPMPAAFGKAMMAADAVATPVNIGTTSVTATVAMQLAICSQTQ